MPLAQLAVRAQNSKTGTAALENGARYLGEATAALAAAFWLGRVITRDGALTDAQRIHLETLLSRGPSFGKWVGLLRESAAAWSGEALAALESPLPQADLLTSIGAALKESEEDLHGAFESPKDM